MRNYNKYHENHLLLIISLLVVVLLCIMIMVKDLYPYRATTEKEIIEKWKGKHKNY